jgi:hypothetical protein
MSTLENWWGYLHEDGSIHAKRVFDPTIQGDLDEAFESPFVFHVVAPFYAYDRQGALKTIEIKAKEWLKTQK